MQSLNEELTTVNAQLRAKMEEHQSASSDLTSLLASTEIAVLFLDTHFRIRRYTPAAQRLIDLIPGDIGRPVSALARKFDDPQLDTDCRLVLERLIPAEREVAASDERHYLRRVTPYRTIDNRIDGVVVTFIDITARNAAERELAAEKEYAESIVATLHEPLLVLHPDLTVKGVNAAFYTHFEVDPSTTIGRKIYNLGNGQWDIPALRTLLEDVLPKKKVFKDYEVRHDFESLGPRVMLVNGRQLDHVQLVLRGVRDVTEERRAEDALRESEARLVAAFEALPSGASIVDLNGRYLLANRELQRYLPSGIIPSRDDPARCARWRAWSADGKLVDTQDFPGARALRGETVMPGLEMLYTHDDATQVWTQVSAVPVRDPEGRIVAAATVITDIDALKRAGTALRGSEERLRLALAAARMGIWTLDLTTRQQTRDANLNRLLGQEPVDSTQAFDEFVTHVHPDDRDVVQEAFGASLRNSTPLGLEFRIERPDGSVRWLRDQGDVFSSPGDRRMMGACVDVTDLKEAEAALRKVNDELDKRVRERTAELAAALTSLEAEMTRRRDLARRLSTVQEDERRRVSRELHDTIGQLMAGMSLELKAVESSGNLPAATANRLAQAQKMLSTLGSEVHGLAVDLRPTSLDDIGLGAALQQLISEWSTRTGIKTSVYADELAAERLPAEVETAIYRVVQEALTNIAKHAQASLVSIVATRQTGVVSVVIEDNGTGFEIENVPKGRLGLMGIRERVELVGGVLDIDSNPGTGTTIAMRIPISAEKLEGT